MYDSHTTSATLAGYVSEQVDLPKPYYSDDETLAIAFLATLVQNLTPPEHRGVDFRHRATEAAKGATPRDYGMALSTLMEMGWGGARVDAHPGTVREIGEQLQQALRDRGYRIAMQLMVGWSDLGRVHSLDRVPVEVERYRRSTFSD